MNKILTICAHPDDEILGCGATIAKLTQADNKAFTLIVGEGRELELNMAKANDVIGGEGVEVLGYPDNRFDSIPLLRIIQSIEKVVEKIKPDTIFTHFRNDLNVDHRLTYQAVLTATRPIKDQSVKTIYSFEVLSSTEWNYPLSFSPNVFFDVVETISLKEKAMGEYSTEVREWPHPRSMKAIRCNASFWGFKVGLEYAEAFELVRQIL